MVENNLQPKTHMSVVIEWSSTEWHPEVQGRTAGGEENPFEDHIAELT